MEIKKTKLQKYLLPLALILIAVGIGVMLLPESPVADTLTGTVIGSESSETISVRSATAVMSSAVRGSTTERLPLTRTEIVSKPSLIL